MLLQEAVEFFDRVSGILGIVQRTVEEHLQSAMRKPGAGNKVHAVALALRDRLISM